jgi:hypothetical protein
MINCEDCCGNGQDQDGANCAGCSGQSVLAGYVQLPTSAIERWKKDVEAMRNKELDRYESGFIQGKLVMLDMVDMYSEPIDYGT